MILLQRTTQDGIVVELALPINNIQEISSNEKDKATSWVKYWVDGATRSTVVSGKVKHITEAINQLKAKR